MRHMLAVLGAALLLAIGIVLLVAGGDEDVLVEPGETTPSTGPGEPAGTQPSPDPNDDQRGDDERTAIELAVARYISAAERGEVEAEGLPTSDELSIESVRVRRERAAVRLVGGAVLRLRKEGGRWRVARAEPAPIPAPTPPSNG